MTTGVLLFDRCISEVVSKTFDSIICGESLRGNFTRERAWSRDMSAGQPRRRVTSAGYRFPSEARPSSWRSSPSLYHENCTPHKERVKSAPVRTYAQRDFLKCDVVKQEEIWKNQCRNESKMTQRWEENWGFLKDYDLKGRLKPKKELPDKVSVFSEKVANTTNQNFGRRVQSAPARTMQRFERLTNYRTKRNKELICYD